MKSKLYKWLRRKYGKILTYPQIEEIEYKANLEYAHPTKNGYCCACEYDIAVMNAKIKRIKSNTR